MNEDINVTNMRIAYKKTTPARRDLGNKRIGTFGEDNMIEAYEEYLSDLGHRVIFSSDCDPEDEKEFLGKHEFLPYDWYFEVAMENTNVVHRLYIECKTQLLSKSNNTFVIQAAKVARFHHLQERGQVIIIACNLRNGTLKTTYYPSKCLQHNYDGSMSFNSFRCGISMDDKYSIKSHVIRELLEEIDSILSPNQLKFSL